jgi:hypothetical protein
LYLNGDGSGKKTHLSLFIVIMRGEYDALLPWPFRNKVWGEDGLRGRHGNVGPADFSHGLEDLGKPPLVTLIHFLL